MNILNIPLGKNAPEQFNVVIEIPRGSSNKYEVDKETGLIKLDRVFYSPMHYPLDYGFLPQTHWYDGDALDALVMTTHPLLPGVLVEVRPIALVRMVDNGDKDEKIIAVAAKDPRFAEYHDLTDLSEHFKKELKHFFEEYKNLEGKKVQVVAIEDRAAALAVVREGMEMYKQQIQSK
ncbi:inorganic diphosphatase [Candidatus Azambacteria bacterium]|nr:inorganic diphosphatase [Candidatus Azambacteria bacterium]MBI3685660.1 inorganic diphosphatase [Candidatus Azambacteria bacterium]